MVVLRSHKKLRFEKSFLIASVYRRSQGGRQSRYFWLHDSKPRLRDCDSINVINQLIQLYPVLFKNTMIKMKLLYVVFWRKHHPPLFWVTWYYGASSVKLPLLQYKVLTVLSLHHMYPHAQTPYWWGLYLNDAKLLPCLVFIQNCVQKESLMMCLIFGWLYVIHWTQFWKTVNHLSLVIHRIVS